MVAISYRWQKEDDKIIPLRRWKMGFASTSENTR
jgi:hypothetical protein